MQDRYTQLEKFRPEKVKYIFIGEAHPCNEEQFFYFESVPKQDNLFMYLIRSVFPDLNEMDTKEIRAKKPEILQRFKDEGYFVDFSVAGSIPKGTTASKKAKLLLEEQDDLLTRIEPYKDAGVILLTATTFKANYELLKEKGYTVLNSSPIPYPGSGQQGNFKQAMLQIGFG